MFSTRKPLPSGLSGYYAKHITPLEARLMVRFSALRRHNWLRQILLAASKLGDGPLWLVTGLVLLAVGDRQTRLAVLAAALAVGTSILLFMAVKNLIGRPRPFEIWPDLPCLLAPPDRFSFPSGHTMTAFSVLGSFAVLLPVLAPWYLAAAVLIGLSRVFLGLHYPTDVLVGALLGLTLGTSAGELTLRCLL